MGQCEEDNPFGWTEADERAEREFEIAEEAARIADEKSIKKLKIILDGLLPKSVGKSVRICWESKPLDDEYWEAQEKGQEGFPDGIESIAKRLRSWVRTDAKDNRIQPYQVERELIAIAASARDLKNKLSSVSLDAKSTAIYLAESFGVCAFPGKMGPDRGLRDWFYYNYPSEDGLAKTDPFLLEDSGDRIDDLEMLALAMDKTAEYVAKQKTTPNGVREKFSNKDALIYLVLMAIVDRNRPIAHVLPIARSIYGWAMDEEPPGDAWGERALERIRKRNRK